MPKLIFLCTRLPSLTHEQYAAHLLWRHVPLAVRHHATLQRYVLNIVEEGVGHTEAIDSVNALYYASLEDFEKRNYDSAEGERIVTEDHTRFLGGAAGYLTQESVYLDSQPPAEIGTRSHGAKWICALRRTPGLPAERFAVYLETEVVPELLAGQPNVSSVVIDRVVMRLYEAGPEWDAFLEIRCGSDDGAFALRGGLARLTDASAIWRVAEHIARA